MTAGVEGENSPDAGGQDLGALGTGKQALNSVKQQFFGNIVGDPGLTYPGQQRYFTRAGFTYDAATVSVKKVHLPVALDLSHDEVRSRLLSSLVWGMFMGTLVFIISAFIFVAPVKPIPANVTVLDINTQPELFPSTKYEIKARALTNDGRPVPNETITLSAEPSSTFVFNPAPGISAGPKFFTGSLQQQRYEQLMTMRLTYLDQQASSDVLNPLVPSCVTDQAGFCQLTFTVLSATKGVWNFVARSQAPEILDDNGNIRQGAVFTATKSFVISSRVKSLQTNNSPPDSLQTLQQPISVAPSFKAVDDDGNPIKGLQVALIAFDHSDPFYTRNEKFALLQSRASMQQNLPPSSTIWAVTDSDGNAIFQGLQVHSSNSRRVYFMAWCQGVFQPWHEDKLQYAYVTLKMNPSIGGLQLLGHPSSINEGNTFQVSFRAFQVSRPTTLFAFFSKNAGALTPSGEFPFKASKKLLGGVQSIAAEGDYSMSLSTTVFGKSGNFSITIFDGTGKASIEFDVCILSKISKVELSINYSPTRKEESPILVRLPVLGYPGFSFNPLVASSLGVSGFLAPLEALNAKTPRDLTWSSITSYYLQFLNSTGGTLLTFTARAVDANGEAVPGKMAFLQPTVAGSLSFISIGVVSTDNIGVTTSSGYSNMMTGFSTISPQKFWTQSMLSEARTQGFVSHKVQAVVDGVPSSQTYTVVTPFQLAGCVFLPSKEEMFSTYAECDCSTVASPGTCTFGACSRSTDCLEFASTLLNSFTLAGPPEAMARDEIASVNVGEPVDADLYAAAVDFFGRPSSRLDYNADTKQFMTRTRFKTFMAPMLSGGLLSTEVARSTPSSILSFEDNSCNIMGNQTMMCKLQLFLNTGRTGSASLVPILETYNRLGDFWIPFFNSPLFPSTFSKPPLTPSVQGYPIVLNGVFYQKFVNVRNKVKEVTVTNTTHSANSLKAASVNIVARDADGRPVPGLKAQCFIPSPCGMVRDLPIGAQYTGQLYGENSVPNASPEEQNFISQSVNSAMRDLSQKYMPSLCEKSGLHASVGLASDNVNAYLFGESTPLVQEFISNFVVGNGVIDILPPSLSNSPIASHYQNQFEMKIPPIDAISGMTVVPYMYGIQSVKRTATDGSVQISGLKSTDAFPVPIEIICGVNGVMSDYRIQLNPSLPEIPKIASVKLISGLANPAGSVETVVVGQPITWAVFHVEVKDEKGNNLNYGLVELEIGQNLATVSEFLQDNSRILNPVIGSGKQAQRNVKILDSIPEPDLPIFSQAILPSENGVYRFVNVTIDDVPDGWGFSLRARAFGLDGSSVVSNIVTEINGQKVMVTSPQTSCSVTSQAPPSLSLSVKLGQQAPTYQSQLKCLLNGNCQRPAGLLLSSWRPVGRLYSQGMTLIGATAVPNPAGQGYFKDFEVSSSTSNGNGILIYTSAGYVCQKSVLATSALSKAIQHVAVSAEVGSMSCSIYTRQGASSSTFVGKVSIGQAFPVQIVCSVKDSTRATPINNAAVVVQLVPSSDGSIPLNGVLQGTENSAPLARSNSQGNALFSLKITSGQSGTYGLQFVASNIAYATSFQVELENPVRGINIVRQPSQSADQDGQLKALKMFRNFGIMPIVRLDIAPGTDPRGKQIRIKTNSTGTVLDGLTTCTVRSSDGVCEFEQLFFSNVLNAAAGRNVTVFFECLGMESAPSQNITVQNQFESDTSKIGNWKSYVTQFCLYFIPVFTFTSNVSGLFLSILGSASFALAAQISIEQVFIKYARTENPPPTLTFVFVMVSIIFCCGASIFLFELGCFIRRRWQRKKRGVDFAAQSWPKSYDVNRMKHFRQTVSKLLIPAKQIKQHLFEIESLAMKAKYAKSQQKLGDRIRAMFFGKSDSRSGSDQKADLIDAGDSNKNEEDSSPVSEVKSRKNFKQIAQKIKIQKNSRKLTAKVSSIQFKLLGAKSGNPVHAYFETDRDFFFSQRILFAVATTAMVVSFAGCVWVWAVERFTQLLRDVKIDLVDYLANVDAAIAQLESAISTIQNGQAMVSQVSSTAQSVPYVGPLTKTLAATATSNMVQVSTIQDRLKALNSVVDSDTLVHRFTNFDEIVLDKLVQIFVQSAFAALGISLILIFCLWVLILRQYRFRMMNLRMGKPFVANPANFKLGKASKYIGYQVMHMACGCLLFSFVLTILSVIIGIIFTFPAVLHAVWKTVSGILLTLLGLQLFITIIQTTIVPKLLFKNGHCVHQRAFAGWDTFVTIITIGTGIAVALARGVLNIVGMVALYARIDNQVLPDKFAHSDVAFLSYVSALHLDHNMNNPVKNVFIDLVCRAVYERAVSEYCGDDANGADGLPQAHQEIIKSQKEKLLRRSISGNQELMYLHSSEAKGGSVQKDFGTSRRKVRNRFWLWITLHNNKALRAQRLHALEARKLALLGKDSADEQTAVTVAQPPSNKQTSMWWLAMWEQ